MVKKTKKKGIPRPKTHREAAPNMFERLGNKKRFEVLGRKTKGEVRNVNKLRSAATEKRKSTLLVEYRQLRKSNAFIDRRFGEDDETLTADERALLRFQKQRLRDLAGSKFTLADQEDNEGEGQGDDGLQLTHLGRSLAELNDSMAGGWGSSDDDDANGQLDDELTRQLHFGGGFLPSKKPHHGQEGGAEEDQEPVRKSKKEVMEEIIAKSKMHKAMKSQQKEEDVQATEALDDAWQQLAQGGALAGLMRPKGSKFHPAFKGDIDESDKKFDALTKELVFEAKAQPGERTLTAEELADLERHRLEELEKQRVKRQRGDVEIVGGDDLEDDFGGDGEGGGGIVGEDGDDGVIPAGGYAARRAKRARMEAERVRKQHEGSDREEDDSEGSDGSDSEEEDGDGETALDRRRRARAAGDHPLQESFRGIMAKLLEKHGMAESDDDDEEEEEGEESGEEEESEEELESSESDDDDDGDAPIANANANAKDGGNMTFTPALPETYADFAALTQGLCSDDLSEILRRIRGFNAAALATDGRKKTQILYGCIMQHYVTLASAVPPAMAHLDALLPHILDLTPQVPFYAATLARARLQRAQQQMAQRLKDPLLRASAWPAPKTLLLLKLLATVYPVSDKRHPVLTPVNLLVNGALTLCPLARPRDVATGLFLASLAVEMHSKAQRYCPEPLQFAVSLLKTALPSSNNRGFVDTGSKDQDSTPRWLALSASECKKSPVSVQDIEKLSMQKIFGSLHDDEDHEGGASYLTSAAFKSSAAAAAIRLIGEIAKSLADVDAFPEMMEEAKSVLQEIVKHAGVFNKNGKKRDKAGKKKSGKDAFSEETAAAGAVTVAPGVGKLAKHVLDEASDAISAAISRRLPLYNAALAAVPEKRQYNPRYEEQFAAGKDYDPDRERADRKRLQRELRREERGAARELRRDAAFMAGVRDKEKAALQADLDASARRAMNFLQQQASDAKSGGQGGMWKKRKNK